MADKLVEQLQNTVTRLENRLSELEAKLAGSSSSKSSDGMRMILIGPPGAGMLSLRHGS